MTGGTAGSAKPPVLLFSAFIDPRGCFCPARVESVSTNSELLSLCVQQSTSRPTQRRIGRSSTGSDYCLIAWGGGRHRRTGGNHSVPNLISTYAYDCLSIYAMARQISKWLLQRRLTPSWRIYPALTRHKASRSHTRNPSSPGKILKNSVADGDNSQDSGGNRSGIDKFPQ